jgi:tetratricopeptide (TPR) repeat protein
MSRGKSMSKKSNPKSRKQPSPTTNESVDSQKWWLPTILVIATMLVIASYFWFDYQSPPLPIAAQKSPADVYYSMISENPENHDAHYNLGLVLQSQGKLEEAITHYRQAIALSGGDARYHNNLGAALAATRKVDEAIEHFNQAIALDPTNAGAFCNLGNAYFSQEKIEEAKNQYRRAIEIKPDYAKAHNNLAVALKQTGQLKQAYQHRYEAMRLERAQQGLTPLPSE